MQWVKTLTGSLISDNGKYKIEKNIHKDVFEVFEMKRNECIGEAFTVKSAKHIAKRREKFEEANGTIQKQRTVHCGRVQKSRRMAD